MIADDIKVWAVMARLAAAEGMSVEPLVALARRVEVVEKALWEVIEAVRDPTLSDAGLISCALARARTPTSSKPSRRNPMTPAAIAVAQETTNVRA